MKTPPRPAHIHAADVDLTPPKGAQEAARRALEVRRTKPPSQRGMTPVGIARARDLSNGKTLSPETVRRMHQYFSRHEVDKKGASWSEQGKGWQAWMGWGGDAGQSWAARKVKQLDASTLHADASTGLGAGVLFVARDTRRVLFVKRSATSESPGTWCGLGGGVDLGETLVQGLRREAYEEGRVTFQFKPIRFAVTTQPGFTFHNFFAFVDTEFQPTLNDEHTEYRWSDKIPYPPHPKMLEALHSYYRSR